MKACLFPGQGSQKVGMGSELFPKYRTMVEKSDEILAYSIEELCLQDDGRLHQTQYTQPALFVVNALSYLDLMETQDLSVDYFAGHSLGEFNALWAAGALSFEDGLRLVKKRGELMATAPRGAMAAVVGTKPERIKEILRHHRLHSIDLANYNTYDQTVLAGPEADIHHAAEFFSAEKIHYIPLKTSGAFHSRYMKESGLSFEQELERVSFQAISIPVISNVTGRPYESDSIAHNLGEQLTQSVQWLKSMEFLLSLGQIDFIECGIGNTLSRMVKSIQKSFKMPNPGPKTIARDESPSGPLKSSEPLKPASNTKSSVPSSREMVVKWNQDHPVGTKVHVKGYDQPLKTKSEAVILFGHRAAIYMEGYNGYFALCDIAPV